MVLWCFILEKLRLFLTQTWTFIVRVLRETFRNKMALFWEFAWPLFWYFLTYFLFIKPGIQGDYSGKGKWLALAGAKVTNAVSYGIFGALTIVLMGFSMMFAADIAEKRYRLYRALPVSPYADFLGRFLGGFVLTIVSLTLTIGVGFLHVRMGKYGEELEFLRGIIAIPIILTSLFLLGIICVGIALLIASVSTDPNYANGISLTILMLLFFITGYNGIQPAFFPGEEWLINYIPTSLATRMILYYVINTSGGYFERAGLAPPVMPHESYFLLLLVVYALIFLGISLFLMERRFYKGEAGE